MSGTMLHYSATVTAFEPIMVNTYIRSRRIVLKNTLGKFFPPDAKKAMNKRAGKTMRGSWQYKTTAAKETNSAAQV